MKQIRQQTNELKNLLQRVQQNQGIAPEEIREKLQEAAILHQQENHQQEVPTADKEREEATQNIYTMVLSHLYEEREPEQIEEPPAPRSNKENGGLQLSS